jgi:hypothetical protein
MSPVQHHTCSPVLRSFAAKAKPAGTVLASQTQNQPERI